MPDLQNFPGPHPPLRSPHRSRRQRNGGGNGSSLLAQHQRGVEPRRPAGRKPAGDEPRHQQGDGHQKPHPRFEGGGLVEQGAEGAGHGERAQEPGAETADQRTQAAAQGEPEELLRTGAQRRTQSQLAAAAAHGVGDNAIDAQRGQEYGEEGE